MSAPRYDFAAMRQSLKAGGVQVVAAPQLFPTPPHVARRMVEYLDGWAGEAWETLRVLEPSAGTGNLIAALFEEWPDARLTAWEINRQLAEGLARKYPAERIRCGDFLTECGPPGPAELFDAVLMNPPFERRIWEKHVSHAFAMLRPGGRLVTILPQATGVQKFLEATGDLDTWEPLPDNTFAGTGVRTGLAVLDKPEADE